MRGLKWAIALGFGSVVTLLQFIAVGALNDASMATNEALIAEKTPPAIIVTQTPKSIKTPKKKPTRVKARASQPRASAIRTQVSALPALTLSQAPLSLGTVLPKLGGIGLGQVPVDDTPSEPDRTARARRTVEPIYPRAAQRNGIEGYVILRLKIDESGRVKNVLVVDSEPIGVFERSARDAARRFEFVPARIGGKPSATTIEKKIVFKLK